MGFGASYSIEKVDCINWVHTSTKKRVIRGFLGCSITVIFYWLPQLIVTSDPSTMFVIHNALPALMSSLFIYGWFPIICLKIGLVD